MTGSIPKAPRDLLKQLARRSAGEPLLLLLDYDGTLVPFAPTPEEASPDAELLGLLGALAVRPDCDVHVVSGRDRATLDAWLSGLPIGLHAEHGLWSRFVQGGPWVASRALPQEWKQPVRALMARFAQDVPGALLEEKSASLAWHYRRVEPELGARFAAQLRRALEKNLAPLGLELLPGDMVLEVRLVGVHKGAIVPMVLARSVRTPFIVAMGDDRTDEDLFRALPHQAAAIHVGGKPSVAGYRLDGPGAARAWLSELLALL